VDVGQSVHDLGAKQKNGQGSGCAPGKFAKGLDAGHALDHEVMLLLACELVGVVAEEKFRFFVLSKVTAVDHQGHKGHQGDGPQEGYD